MASVNKVILVGNLGVDPEKRYTGAGNAVCNLRMATSEHWTDKEGNKQERTEWHRVVVFGAQAENCERYLSKGRQIYVEGSIRTRSWDDKDGNKRYTTEVVAQRVQFLGGAPKNQGPAADTSDANAFPPVDSAQQFGSAADDDVPF